MEIKYGIEEPDHTLIITVDWDTQSDVAKKKKKQKWYSTFISYVP